MTQGKLHTIPKLLSPPEKQGDVLSFLLVSGMLGNTRYISTYYIAIELPSIINLFTRPGAWTVKNELV